MNKKSVVAIVKVENENIYNSVIKLLSLLGGIETIVSPFDVVLIKPNWVTDKHYSTGAVTHPDVIKSCTELVLKAGAKKVIIGDSSYVGKDTSNAIRQSGLNSMISRRVEIIDFKKSEYISTFIPGALKYRRIKVPKVVLESDVIINIPVMKTHDCLPVTLGLKNMKGILRDSDKRKLHKLGLEEGIIDINRIVLPDLTIIDGIIGMEGNGPIEGIPVGMKVLMASQDPLAVEVVAVKAMGLDPNKIRYINMARNADFGESNLDNIEIVGEPLEGIERRFALWESNREKLSSNNVHFHEQSACSTCRHTINTFFQEKANADLGEIKNICFFAGGIGRYTDKCEMNIKIGVGNCLCNMKDKFDYFVSGCPPSKIELKRLLSTILKNKMRD